MLRTVELGLELSEGLSQVKAEARKDVFTFFIITPARQLLLVAPSACD